jgi:hypothetical protein
MHLAVRLRGRQGRALCPGLAIAPRLDAAGDGKRARNAIADMSNAPGGSSFATTPQ